MDTSEGLLTAYAAEVGQHPTDPFSTVEVTNLFHAGVPAEYAQATQPAYASAIIFLYAAGVPFEYVAAIRGHRRSREQHSEIIYLHKNNVPAEYVQAVPASVSVYHIVAGYEGSLAPEYLSEIP